MTTELIGLVIAGITPILGFIGWLIRLEAKVNKNTEDIKLGKEELRKVEQNFVRQRAEDQDDRQRQFDKLDTRLNIIQDDIKHLIRELATNASGKDG